MNGASSVYEARKARRNLVSRSRPARTFGGLAVFVALLFLSCGIYLIAEPLLHPIANHEAEVIAGAFTIALASILLFYLAKPAASHHRLTVERHKVPAQPESAGFAEATRPQANGIAADAHSPLAARQATRAEWRESIVRRECCGDAARGRR
jgi:hypothetical protein